MIHSFASRRGVLAAGLGTALPFALPFTVPLALAACNQAALASFHGTDVSGAPYGKDFRLTDAEGRERRLADFIIGLSTDLAHTAETAKEFKVFYQKVPTGSSYTMDHSTFSYVFDPAGRLRLVLRHEQTAQDYAEDLRQLLRALTHGGHHFGSNTLSTT